MTGISVSSLWHVMFKFLTTQNKQGIVSSRKINPCFLLQHFCNTQHHTCVCYIFLTHICQRLTCMCACVHRVIFTYDGITDNLKLADSGGKTGCSTPFLWFCLGNIIVFLQFSNDRNLTFLLSNYLSNQYPFWTWGGGCDWMNVPHAHFVLQTFVISFHFVSSLSKINMII